jgi:hypothetical protein
VIDNTIIAGKTYTSSFAARDRQYMYNVTWRHVRITIYFCGTAVSVTCSECVPVVLGIQQADACFVL